MSCCSYRRQALSVSLQLRAAVSVGVQADWMASAAAPSASLQRLRYVGSTPLNVRGPTSARLYEVDVPQRLIDADVRDVAALLRMGLFERAG